MKKAYKKVGRLRFSFIALLKLWEFQIVAGLLLALPISGLDRLLTWVANSTGSAVTTANISQMLNWRLPVILGLGLTIMFIYFTVEILAHVYLCEDILHGESLTVLEYLKKGFKALRHFANPKGLLIILFIFIGVPICGAGFSVSITQNLYIPNFITDVIFSNPLYSILYTLVILCLIYVGRVLLFVFHFVLIDRLTVSEAIKESRKLLKENKWNFMWRLIKILVLMNLLTISASLLFQTLPTIYLEEMGATLPIRYTINYANPSALDQQVLQYRILSSLTVFTGSAMIYMVGQLVASNYMMAITKIFNEYTHKKDTRNFVPYSPARTIVCTIEFLALILLMVGYSLISAFNFEELYFAEDTVKITAHRTGGKLASENSLEGIDAAVEHNCYGSETDIQRTADDHYIINHDNSFKRLTGDPHKPGELTLEQIKQLRINDTTGNGNLLEVPTMEELLDRGKGRITLFLELKGVSADKEMADAIVAAVRERDMVDDVILISLNYDVIDYVETNYPEFETGVLIFSAIGDVSRLNCDMVIMEEEMSSSTLIETIHYSGKKVGVWTVNTDYSLHHFLDSDADTIITDEVENAIKIQKELDERTDLQILEDYSENMFK